MQDIDEHKLDLSDLYQRYNTNPKTGLTDTQAEEILNRDGPNSLPQPKITSEQMIFFRQICSGFAFLFWICGILCFIAYGLSTTIYEENTSINYLWLGIVLIIVVIVSGTFSYSHKSKSKRIMDSLISMARSQTIVIRNGEKKQIDIEDLVTGDIIEVNSGDIIPADIRIIESSGFKVNNSDLTGESEPQTRSIEFTNDNPLETKNLAFQSTSVAEGTAKGLVIRTGGRTVIGRLSNAALSQPTHDSPIIKEIARTISTMTRVAIFIGILFFIIALSLGYSFIESVILLLVIIITNAPKTLSITVTVCLALIAKQMGRKNCFVNKLESVETLGSTSVICVDKTGTLTQNKLAVAHAWFDNKIVEVNLSKGQSLSTFYEDSNTSLALARCAILCNRADFKHDPENLSRSILDCECNGDSTEVAILKYAASSVDQVTQMREAERKVYEIPYNATNRYQLSIHETYTDDEDEDNSRPYLLVMKGAPERIFELCSSIYIDGTDVDISIDYRDSFDRAYLELGSLGERVLGFCDLRLPLQDYPHGYDFDADDNFPTGYLRFLGLMSMIDPPRASVPDAIMKCQSAGIKVIMMTGDHPITSENIARAVNIISKDSESVNSSDAKVCVIHGNDLRSKTSAEINTLLNDYTEIVFARTSPQQKSTIVEAFQRQGAIVTMIGDGVSDLPALQQADVAIVMGRDGSTTSKQKADIILMDDNFASIVTGVEQGRLMFDNLKKSFNYAVTSNVPKMISILICLLTNIPLTWGISTILCIDFINIIGAISLAYGKAETDIMKKRPRDPQHDQLTNKRFLLISYGLIGIIQVATGFFAYYLVMIDKDFVPSPLSNLETIDDQQKQLEFTCYTAFIITIIICQWATLIIFKNRRDSIMQQSIKFLWWLPAWFYVFLILICDEVRKYIIRPVM